MPKQVYSEEGSLGNRCKGGAEQYAALNNDLAHVKLTEGAFAIVFEEVLHATSDKAITNLSAALEQLNGLGLPKKQAYDLHEDIWDGAMLYTTSMTEAAFIAGCELGYRGLVVKPAEDNGRR
jgi:hypothetical protein